MDYTDRGTYSSSTTYYQYNVVTYSNVDFVCISDLSGAGITGIEPSNSTYWNIFDPLIIVVPSRQSEQMEKQKEHYQIFTQNIFDDVYKAPGEILIPKIDKIELPTDKDYKKGYMYRYFYRQSNRKMSYVREINKGEYNKIKNYFLYDVLRIKWKLIGDRDKTKRINERIINISNQKLVGIKFTLLRDPLQYWINEPDIVPEEIDVTYKYQARAYTEEPVVTTSGVTAGTLSQFDYLISDSDRYISEQDGDVLLTQNYVAIMIQDNN